MSSQEKQDKLIKDILSRAAEENSSGEKTSGGESGDIMSSITPQKVLVIIGLLADVLRVDSVLVDRNQTMEVVLVGSMKRKTKKKTETDKIIEQIGAMPFEEVLRAFIGRLT